MRPSDLTASDRAAIEDLWRFHVVQDPNARGDILLVLGSHDLSVAKHAAALYRDRVAPLVFVTGGAGKVTGTHWDLPEAERYAQVLTSNGVPAEKIKIEREATNTGDNFSYSRRLCNSLGLNPSTGIVVCKPYMARRALAAGQKQWSDVKWFARPPLVDVWEYPSAEVPLDRMINLMVGDLQRLDVYAEKGFQAPVDIPDRVWASYDHLVNRGFDAYVLH